MAVPTYDKCMLPMLQLVADGEVHWIKNVIDSLAEYFGLTEEELAELLPSGRDTTFSNRVRWANTYLRKARLLESTGRGRFRITERGLNTAANPPEAIDIDFLMQFPSFVEFRTRSEPMPLSSSNSADTDETRTPQEILHSSYQSLREQLIQDLLDQIMECSSAFFERLVVDLLLAMGYGSSIDGAGRVIGKTGDGGIDGIISEDKLGFDAVYIQAKQWKEENVVSRPVVQSFAGSLLGQGVTKGVILTTSRFSKEAIDYANSTKQLRIILIEGRQLAELMIDHNIGVSPVETYTLKKIDADYFSLE